MRFSFLISVVDMYCLVMMWDVICYLAFLDLSGFLETCLKFIQNYMFYVTLGRYRNWSSWIVNMPASSKVLRWKKISVRYVDKRGGWPSWWCSAVDPFRVVLLSSSVLESTLSVQHMTSFQETWEVEKCKIIYHIPHHNQTIHIDYRN